MGWVRILRAYTRVWVWLYERSLPKPAGNAGFCVIDKNLCLLKIRLASQLTAIVLANGYAAGVRLWQRLGFNISCNTLLNLVHTIPLPSFNSLKIVGVDDFCFHDYKTYGTIIVDLKL